MSDGMKRAVLATLAPQGLRWRPHESGTAVLYRLRLGGVRQALYGDGARQGLLPPVQGKGIQDALSEAAVHSLGETRRSVLATSAQVA